MKSLQPQSGYAMTFEEIGQRLGITAACAKECCYRGMRKLAKSAEVKQIAETARFTSDLRAAREDLQESA